MNTASSVAATTCSNVDITRVQWPGALLGCVIVIAMCWVLVTAIKRM